MGLEEVERRGWHASWPRCLAWHHRGHTGDTREGHQRGRVLLLLLWLLLLWLWLWLWLWLFGCCWRCSYTNWRSSRSTGCTLACSFWCGLDRHGCKMQITKLCGWLKFLAPFKVRLLSK